MLRLRRTSRLPEALYLVVAMVVFPCPTALFAQTGVEAPPTASEVVVKSKAEVKRIACHALGLPEDTEAIIEEPAEKTLLTDRTPFLHDEFVRRAPVVVVFQNLKFVLPSGISNKYVRTVRVYLDPKSGQVLKITTDWPNGETQIAPEPESQTATEQLRSKKEIYHAFPMGAPTISLLDALDVIQSDGGGSKSAKQIIARWVLWSRLGSDPKPMWVITLRGIPPVRPHRDVHPDALNHLRYVVDPEKKKWITATTSPQPINTEPEVESDP